MSDRESCDRNVKEASPNGSAGSCSPSRRKNSSRSRSGTPNRSPSRSPGSTRRRHQGDRTGRSRGFGFVYFDNVADAESAKDACDGIDIDDRKIRVDFSITKRPHTPTPGIYMGRATQRSRGHRGSYGYDRYDDYDRYDRGDRYDRYDRGDRYDRYDKYRRSPSPYRRGHYSRSRSPYARYRY